ncbi:MAG: aminotransferase class I/II-fold pyridoxal phosphate-dependent enzyme [Planctomycetota bacterium]
MLAAGIDALEGVEGGVITGSGMAAISTALLAVFRKGDHLVVQKNLYRGAFRFITRHLEAFGVSWSETRGTAKADFEAALRAETKAIFIESPTNPRLTVTDIAMVTALARDHGLLTLFDNTFATPINQQPIAFGVDLVFHSAAKFLGGHGDLAGGVVVGREGLIRSTETLANTLGGSLGPQVCHLLQRSLQTLALRIERINENALQIAHFLDQHPSVSEVFYPGLSSHEGHGVAKRQMSGFGGIIAFDLAPDVEPLSFQRRLQLIHTGNSLGELFTSLNSPALASTSLGELTETERAEMGVTRQLVRLSVGIEDARDLIDDVDRALSQADRS